MQDASDPYSCSFSLWYVVVYVNKKTHLLCEKAANSKTTERESGKTWEPRQQDNSGCGCIWPVKWLHVCCSTVRYRISVLGILSCWALRTETMAKCTKKMGIVDKYGTHYGALLRKMVKKIEISQHAKYSCSFCGKTKTEEEGCWYLTLWVLRGDSGWRRLDIQHNFHCHSQVQNQETEAVEDTVTKCENHWWIQDSIFYKLTNMASTSKNKAVWSQKKKKKKF